jgi:hypothetical protein
LTEKVEKWKKNSNYKRRKGIYFQSISKTSLFENIEDGKQTFEADDDSDFKEAFSKGIYLIGVF